MKVNMRYGIEITILKITAMTLFVALPFVGFFAGMSHQKSVTGTCQQPKVVKLTAKPTTAPTPAIIMGKFFSQRYSYSAMIPDGWRAEVKESGPYSDLFVYSPDYAKSGVSIFIRVEDTREKSVDEYFEHDFMAQGLAENIKTAKYGDRDMIQYDYAYEGVRATDTIFVNNGKKYLIKLDHLGRKQQYWKEYQAFIKSFRI
jgi:hypothetical protein